ncbi:MAG: RICIN domain-containing protein [Ignavibacteriaceae bacterium]
MKKKHTLLVVFLLTFYGIFAPKTLAQKQVGIFYFPVFGTTQYSGSSGMMAPNGDSWIMQGQNPLYGPYSSANFWGKPLWAATHGDTFMKDNYIFYLNGDTAQPNNALLDWHAELITRAGIDFIVLDFTNGAQDFNNNNGQGPSYISATKALCKRYQERLAAGLPFPKIVFFVKDSTTLKTVESTFFTQYNSGLFYTYLGKKLLLVADPLENGNNSDPSQPAVPTSGDFANYTARHCWGNMTGGTCWQFKTGTPQPAFYYNGLPEEMCATVADAGYSNGAITGYGRSNGNNFLSFMNAAKTTGPQFLFIHSFNEWAAGNWSATNPQTNPLFVDQWLTEYSSDIEPHLGGYSLGNSAIYYELAKEQIWEFKGEGYSMTESPYDVWPYGIPGRIQSVNFDYGGEGVAYHDDSPSNLGGKYRNIINAVDIQACSEGGYNVGWIDTGEWIKYTVNVATTGSYTINSRVASPNTGAEFHLEIDGINVTGTLTVPNTGNYETWATISNTVNLTAGQHIVRFYADNGGFNIEYWDFALNSLTVPDGIYKLIDKNAGKCLDVTGASVSAGANIQQWSDNQQANQMWKITNLNNGYYKLSSVCSGFACCLDVAGGSTSDGANIQQYTDNGNSQQQWKIVNLNNGGYYKLVDKNANKCADVAGGSTSDGANVQQWTDNGNAQQQWRLVWIGNNGLTPDSIHGMLKRAVGPDIQVDNQHVARNFMLYQNYPNPFNPSTEIKYSIPKSGIVTIKVYNLLGQEVATLVNQEQKSGNYVVNFDASKLASGVYMYQIQANGFSLTKKMALLK